MTRRFDQIQITELTAEQPDRLKRTELPCSCFPSPKNLPKLSLLVFWQLLYQCSFGLHHRKSHHVD